jgi:hypothetical protein
MQEVFEAIPALGPEASAISENASRGAGNSAAAGAFAPSGIRNAGESEIWPFAGGRESCISPFSLNLDVFSEVSYAGR